MRKRFIRLKEHMPGVDKEHTPNDRYISMSNESLKAESYRMKVSNDGFITTGNAIDTEKRIYILGDSFVESTFVHEEDRFSAFLERKLTTYGYSKQVLNGGYSGSSSLHLLLNTIAKIINNRPSDLLLVIPSNDVYSLSNNDGYWNQYDERYSVIVPPLKSPEGFEAKFDITELNKNLNQLDFVISQFVSATEYIGCNLFLATVPYVAEGFENEAWFRRRYKSNERYFEILEGRKALNDMVRQLANRYSLHMIDLEKTISLNPDFFYDELHLNARGSTLVGEALTSFFVEYYRRKRS